MIKWIQQLILSVLVLTTPVLGMSHAVAAATIPSIEVPAKPFDAFDVVPSISYEQIIDFLDGLEEGEFDYVDNPEDVECVIEFITYLAKRGARFVDGVDWVAIEEDSAGLKSKEDLYCIGLSSVPSARLLYSGGYNEHEIELCKSWVSKKIHQVKKYAKKHKKALIIGGAVVVAAVAVVVVAVAVTAASGAAALGEAGAASASAAAALAKDENKKSSSKESSPSSQQSQKTEASPVLPTPSPSIAAAVDAQIEAFRETPEDLNPMAGASYSPSIVEVCKDAASMLVHDAVKGAFEFGSFVPRVQEEVQNLLPLNSSTDSQLFSNGLSPTENYRAIEKRAQAAVDRLLATDMADRYTREATPVYGEVVTGYVPIPGGFSRLKPTLVRPVKGWKVGEPINNQTPSGATPKWNTVRIRYWKNEAHLNADSYSKANVERMKMGLAPKVFNKNTGQWESMELHHIPPQREGGLFDVVPVTPEEHALVDQYRKLKGE